MFVGRLDAQLVEPAATLVSDEVSFSTLILLPTASSCLLQTMKTLTSTKQSVENARQAVLPQQCAKSGNAVSVVPTFVRQDV